MDRIAGATLNSAARQKPHVILLGSTNLWLANVRGDFIKALLARGYRVTAVAEDYEKEAAAMIESWGATYRQLALGRSRLMPFADLGAIFALHSLMRRIRPQIFFAYTAKPVVYGLIAARVAGVPRRVVMITGLGYAFTEGPELKRRLARQLVTVAYWVALRFADRVIFQNPDDQELFLTRRLLKRPERAARVNGSGVNLTHYAPVPFPDGPITFLMIARLLRDKGLYEYVEAARIVKRRQPKARFVLVGPYDTNPSSVRPKEVESWVREGTVEYRGTLSDVRPEIAACHVYVLPSYYREGVPRSILEAMAMGRPIITTDAPGCRETVIDGRSGFLIPVRDAKALAGACLRIVENPEFITAAGAASLTIVREKFDANVVSAALVRLTEGR